MRRSLPRTLGLLLALSVLPAVLAEEKPAAKQLFNGKDTTGWVLRSLKTTVTVYQDADGKPIPGAKMTKVDQKDVVVDSKNKVIEGAKIVDEGGKKKIVDVDGKVIEGAKVNKTGGRDVLVDGTGKPVEKYKAVQETKANPSGWTVVDGLLVCNMPHGGNDLITEEKFTDFELHVEFLATGNSGVYLQGRYEIQIDNNYGTKPKIVEKEGKKIEVFDSHQCGAIYGKVAPSKNMAKKPDEWQSYDVTFHGARPAADGKPATRARATIIWNGEKVIDNAEIDGPTGAALDSKVTEPGPILLQGDHGKVSFKNIRITPLSK
jgi:hypothetical protein